MPTCEYCGEGHAGSYGSGRFCSGRCARGFSTRAKRKSINGQVQLALSGRKVGNAAKGAHYPYSGSCGHCGAEYEVSNWQDARRKYCSDECRTRGRTESLSKALKGKCGGVRRGSGRGHGGWYRGVWCDSTYELAYLAWCELRGITVTRNKQFFRYGAQQRRYFPDFVHEDGSLVEIKGFVTAESREKEAAVLGLGLSIRTLTKTELAPVIQEVKDHFRVPKLAQLYDHPSDRLEARRCQCCLQPFMIDPNKAADKARKYCSRVCGGKGPQP